MTLRHFWQKPVCAGQNTPAPPASWAASACKPTQYSVQKCGNKTHVEIMMSGSSLCTAHHLVACLGPAQTAGGAACAVHEAGVHAALAAHRPAVAAQLHGKQRRV